MDEWMFGCLDECMKCYTVHGIFVAKCLGSDRSAVEQQSAAGRWIVRLCSSDWLAGVRGSTASYWSSIRECLDAVLMDVRRLGGFYAIGQTA